MKKQYDIGLTASELERKRQEGFWLPDENVNFQAEFEEFNRLFGLRPELAEFLGVRQFLREDTLKSQH